MPRSARPTRERLIATAERLFAERGLDGVSLNEITRAAGQRNASALQYHFGGRAGLIEAILDKHQPAIDLERQRRLQLLEAGGDSGNSDLIQLVRILVMPLVRKMEDEDGGAAYIRVMAQLIGNPAYGFLDERARRVNVGRDQLMRAVARRLPGIARPTMRMRTLLVTSMLFHGLSDFARLRDAQLVAASHQELFVSSLIDGLVGIFNAEELRAAALPKAV
jgi:AcrR family transcriptional regulator